MVLEMVNKSEHVLRVLEDPLGMYACLNAVRKFIDFTVNCFSANFYTRIEEKELKIFKMLVEAIEASTE